VRLTKVVAAGAWGKVECVVRENGECPAEDFLTRDLEDVREKGKDKAHSTARARFMALFQVMADIGQLSGSRFKGEMEGFFAFKHEVKNRQIRFPCFRDGRAWIITHGFFKPGARKGLGVWPENEIQRAKSIRREYFERKQQLSKSRNRRI
jgi:hypothetical protein